MNSKRLLSCLTSVTILFSMMCCFPVKITYAITATTLSNSQITEKITELQSRYPSNSYWNHDYGQQYDGSGVTNTPCPNGNPNNGRCNNLYGGSQCYAFARQIAKEVFGSYPELDVANASVKTGTVSNGWTAIKDASMVTLEPGDIIRADYNNHTAIIWKIEGQNVYVAQCWGTSGCKIWWGSFYGNNEKKTISELLNNGFTGVWKHPDSVISNNKKWYEDMTPENLGNTFCAYIENSTTGGYLQNEGWNVAAYSGSGKSEQVWLFNRLSDGSYTITSLLDVNNMTVCNPDENGSSIVVTTDPLDDSQRWFIYYIDNRYVLRPVNSDRVIDLDGGGSAAGTNIQIYDYNESSSQYFNIKKNEWYDSFIPEDLGSDFYANISNNTTGGYLNNEGWNVAAYSGTGAKDQVWHFSKNEDGSYIINSLLDNARLTTCDSKDNNGASVVVTHDEVDSAQKWFVYKTNKGYIFRFSTSDKIMEVEGGGYVSGTNLQLYDLNCTYSQFFEIKRVDAPTSDEFILGDCNDDGAFNISDVVVLQNWLLGRNKNLDNWKAADLCEDEKLNVFDLCLMRRKLIYG